MINETAKLLPMHSASAEQAVIGGLILSGQSAWDIVADLVSESDFYLDAHRRVFRHIKQLVDASVAIDILSVSDAIDSSNETEQVGGLAYLVEVANTTPSSANIAVHAKIVKEKARVRALVGALEDARAIACAPGIVSAQDRINAVNDKLSAIAVENSRGTPKSMAGLLTSVVNNIEARTERGEVISGLSTGFCDLDEILDGLKGGDLTVVAGRPSMGKTAFALNIAENVALDGSAAMIFSMEMSDVQLVTRTLSSVARVDGKTLMSGKLSNDDWDRVASAMGRLVDAPLIIDESTSLSVSEIRARARRQQQKGGLALVVIDYLQLMSGRGNNRNEELGDITRGLKLMARDLNVPVILLSQLSRKVEERADKRPIMSDLRESGSIEQDADVVMMVYRDEYYNKDTQFKGIAEIGVRKNRMGSCGDVRMVFNPEFSAFGNADQASLARMYAMADERRNNAGRRG